MHSSYVEPDTSESSGTTQQTLITNFWEKWRQLLFMFNMQTSKLFSIHLSAGRFRKFDKFFSSRVTDLVLHQWQIKYHTLDIGRIISVKLTK